ncbi:outer membrane lipoprotein [Poseidonibacter lekithochrous]|uniref:glycine zipper 2TM domain-containing protein n=1 Tax=Poseidonibacter lekithochrous TaxID=1904463 RepID=UPI000D3327A0|nr:glycine zipper 2TM domain-containing protein [Poseidonibacter lekithochrous]
MKKLLSIIFLAVTLVFTGCMNNNDVSYDYEDYKKIKQVMVGTILNTRAVNIKDDGKGSIIGAIGGGVLGSTIGKGNGSTLATLGGAALGGFIGNSINKTKAQELTVRLENGETIVVLSKETAFINGDRIRIVKVGDEVSSVYKL